MPSSLLDFIAAFDFLKLSCLKHLQAECGARHIFACGLSKLESRCQAPRCPSHWGPGGFLKRTSCWQNVFPPDYRTEDRFSSQRPLTPHTTWACCGSSQCACLLSSTPAVRKAFLFQPEKRLNGLSRLGQAHPGASRFGHVTSSTWSQLPPVGITGGQGQWASLEVLPASPGSSNEASVLSVVIK